MRETIEQMLVVENLVAVLMNFEVDFLFDYVKVVNAQQGIGENSYDPKKLDLDLKIRPSTKA